jgi:hypothetical protein
VYVRVRRRRRRKDMVEERSDQQGFSKKSKNNDKISTEKYNIGEYVQDDMHVGVMGVENEEEG